MKAVYIHIPFCKTICSYCDFCKMFYNDKFINKYLGALQKEIMDNYKGDIIKTIYVGGGTPSCLSIDSLNKLFQIIKVFNFDKNIEFTFECNVNDINNNLLMLLKENGVNRLSIGIESFNDDNLNLLNRKHNYEEVKDKISLIRSNGFKNINVDLMYAIPGENIEILKDDILKILSLEVEHISTYSLIIEDNTVLGINKIDYIDEDIDYEMYKLINKELVNSGYEHYEVSNYSKKGYESKHNLTYWTNDEYYGFGLGASGFIDNIRYDNTRSLNNYCNNKYRLNEEFMTKEKNMENEMILGLRKTDGVSKKKFYEKYNINIENVFKIDKLIKERKLINSGDNIYINDDYLYLSNDILINFVGEV